MMTGNRSLSVDVIVIGAGHNGLTAAASLAKAGKKVVVLEQHHEVGGGAGSRTLSTDVRVSAYLHDTSTVRPDVLRELQLEKFGLRVHHKSPSIFVPKVGTQGLMIHHDPEVAEQELLQFCPSDVDAYRQYRQFFAKIRPLLASVFEDRSINLFHINLAEGLRFLKKAISLRMLGERDMMELLRIAPMSVGDWLDEWFSCPELKGALAFPAVMGQYLGPKSPASNINLLRHETLSQVDIEGGAPALVDSLVKCCQAHGVTILTSQKVRSILREDTVARGVWLENGERWLAPTVIATCDPKQLILDLLQGFSPPLEQKAQQLRARGTAAKVLLALKDGFEFRKGHFPERIRIVDSLDDLERSFDPVKYGELPERPTLDIYMGRDTHSASIWVNFVPYQLRSIWSDQKKEELLHAVLCRLEEHLPHVHELIEDHEVLTPKEIERDLLLSGGQLFHLEHAADQLLTRPFPLVKDQILGGLYLGGSGAHPGGGITCAPGYFAAKAVMS